MLLNHKFRYKIIFLTALLLLTVRIGLIGGGLVNASSITISSVLSAVNNERTQRNIPSLRTDTRLSTAAQSKSEDMITRKYFAHVDPDGHYIWDKIVADGYSPYTILGENLAIDFSDTEGLVAAWIDSPTHRANLLNPSFKDQGMGVALGDVNQGQYTIAVTNTFGAQPAPAQPSTPATKPSTAANPKPAKTTPPAAAKSAPAPQQAPKVVVKKGITLSIKNTETIIHTDHFTLNGTIDSAANITLTDVTDKSSHVVQPDSSGNFHYDYTKLSNGNHIFVASAAVDGNSVTTPPFTLAVDTSMPTIDPSKIQISASLKNNGINLHILGATSANTAGVTATVSSQTANLPVNGSSFEGDLNLADRYTDLSQSTLVLGAVDIYGNKSSAELPLKGISLPDGENPKSLTGAGNPTDLYNVFKYVVIFFGAIFTIALIGDSFFLRKKKITDLDQIGGASNFLLLLLIISTLLLVRWWN